MQRHLSSVLGVSVVLPGAAGIYAVASPDVGRRAVHSSHTHDLVDEAV